MTCRLPMFCSLLLCLVGCTDGDLASDPPATSPPSATSPAPVGGSLRYLALGDSYTKGEGVEDAERWPGQLAARLRSAGFDVADPQIVAETGWRTDHLNAAITRAPPQGPFQLVSLLIGVNNQYHGRTAEAYRNEFEVLLRRAIDLAGGEPSRVLVLSIPDWGATPFGQSQGVPPGPSIDRFNAVNLELSREAGVRYVDVTPISRAAATDPALTIGDDLHPSGKMYATWVDLALPEAEQAFKGAAADEP